MDVLILARLQFATTTIFHYFYVPLSIGLALFIAILQTRSLRSGDETMKPLIKFLGKLFTITFAMGVATGIVQEFQFGMNWSEYARYVGDIFGVPLAIEALLAFFIEATFLGLWIFGWDKLSKRLHLACIWLVAAATSMSAFWILVANSFMQNPVGYTFNAITARAELTSFTELITNPYVAYQYAHVLTGALATTGFFVLAISAYQIMKGRDLQLFHKAFKQAAVFAIIGTVAVIGSGHSYGVFLTEQQPMKMAAMEAHWNTADAPDLAIIAFPDKDQGRNTFAIKVPGMLSFLAYNEFGRQVQGINDIQKKMADQYGPGDYIPNVWVTFYSFRFMVAAGSLMLLMSILALLWRQPEKLAQRQMFLKLLIPCMLLPMIANTCGWLVAEVGRQPWIVYGLQTVNQGVSQVVAASAVLLSLLGFTVLYITLLGITVMLMIKICSKGLTAETIEQEPAMIAAAEGGRKNGS